MKKLMKFLRNLFEKEWLYRTFIVTQILGLITICIMDITERNWDFLRISNYGFEWRHFALLDYNDWRRYPFQNYITLFAIFFPLPITKAIDWILGAKEK